jgi:hypothetical protein
MERKEKQRGKVPSKLPAFLTALLISSSDTEELLSFANREIVCIRVRGC